MRCAIAALFLAALGLLPPLLAEVPGVLVGLLLILFGLRLSRLRRGCGCSSRPASAPGQASSPDGPAARAGGHSGAPERPGRVSGRLAPCDALQGPLRARAGVRSLTDRQVLRLLPTCLAVWRRAGSPAHGIVFEVICRAWAIEDRRACPGSYEEAR